MMEKYNIEETMAFTGHRLIEPGRVEDIKAQLRIKIKALYAKGIRIYLSGMAPVSYTHLTLPTKAERCRSRWSPYH